MGRPSKLSPQQWAEVERRMAEGETPSALAKEFDVHPAQITRRVSQISQKVRNVAQKVADAESALAELPTRQQYQAMTLAEKYRNTTDSLASAAELAAKNSHRLHSLANTQLQKVDDTDPAGSEGHLKTVAVLTKMGNDAAATPINLLAANKGQKGPEGDDPEKPRGVLVVPGLMADTQAWAANAQAVNKGER